MTMPLKIVTDSTCDLPEALIARYDITVVPLYINIGSASYLDGVELSRQEFYEQLPFYRPAPTTAAPGPTHFRQVYEQLAAQGATEILSIHVAGNFSATFNNARLAAQQVPHLAITTFDSQQMSMGLGFLVLKAAQAAAKGQTTAEIVTLLETQLAHIHLFAILDTLQFLKASGRIDWLQAGLGNLLQLKPLLTLHQGQISTAKVRTSKQASHRLQALLGALPPVEQAVMLHSHAPDKAGQLRQHLADLLPSPPQRVPLVEITPLLGSHVGPGAVGVACLTVSQREIRE
jgi:DegV family protein with EDD domain